MESKTAPTIEFINALNQFGLEMYGQIKTNCSDSENIFFSPFSLAVALSALLAGAEGETASQLKTILKLEMTDEDFLTSLGELNALLAEIAGQGSVQLQSANALWHHAGFDVRESYREKADQYFDMSIDLLGDNPDDDADKINAWVAQKTNQMIDGVVGAEDLINTSAVFVNAIYFKGNWLSQFERSQTLEKPFWVEPNQAVIAPIMEQENCFALGEYDNAIGICLPYLGEQVAMFAFLPIEENQSLAVVENKFPDLLYHRLRRYPTRHLPANTKVRLPRFSLETRYEKILKWLTDLGWRDKTQFGGLTSQPENFVIDKILQVAKLKVDEEGTEAAAASAIVGHFGPPEYEVFDATRPFLFTLSEKSSGLILFMGRLVNPTGAAPIPREEIEKKKIQ